MVQVGCSRVYCHRGGFRVLQECGFDECLVCLQVQALIQGRASAWQQNLVLTPTKGGAGDPVSRTVS